MHGHEIPPDDYFYREAIPEGPPSDRAITTRMSRWRWLWITLLIVFVGIAAIAVWQVFFDDELTVTFDGTSATYEGPATIERGAVTIVLENASDTTVSYWWTRLRDAEITLEEARAWSRAGPEERPSWFGLENWIGDVASRAVITATTTFSQEGRHLVYAVDDTSGTVYPAAVIDVTLGEPLQLPL